MYLLFHDGYHEYRYDQTRLHELEARNHPIASLGEKKEESF